MRTIIAFGLLLASYFFSKDKNQRSPLPGAYSPPSKVITCPNAFYRKICDPNCAKSSSLIGEALILLGFQSARYPDTPHFGHSWQNPGHSSPPNSQLITHNS